MRRFPSWLVSSLVLAAACSKPADKAPEAPPADSAMAAAPAPASPQAIVTVIYNPPKRIPPWPRRRPRRPARRRS